MNLFLQNGFWSLNLKITFMSSIFFHLQCWQEKICCKKLCQNLGYGHSLFQKRLEWDGGQFLSKNRLLKYAYAGIGPNTVTAISATFQNSFWPTIGPRKPMTGFQGQ